MNEAVPSAGCDRAAAAPGWLRRLGSRPPAGGRTWLIESGVLVLVGVLLASATINDLVRQTDVNHRLNVDLRTWRSYTHHNYHDLSVSQDVHGLSTREVVCGNTTPGGLRERTQLCLQITGAERAGRRSVSGGWYLPPKVENVRRYRYACFGPAVLEARCPL
jgi:hypothetical protein